MNLKKQDEPSSYLYPKQECLELDENNKTENETEWKLLSQRRLLLDAQIYPLSEKETKKEHD